MRQLKEYDVEWFQNNQAVVARPAVCDHFLHVESSLQALPAL